MIVVNPTIREPTPEMRTVVEFLQYFHERALSHQLIWERNVNGSTTQKAQSMYAGLAIFLDFQCPGEIDVGWKPRNNLFFKYQKRSKIDVCWKRDLYTSAHWCYVCQWNSDWYETSEPDFQKGIYTGMTRSNLDSETNICYTQNLSKLCALC